MYKINDLSTNIVKETYGGQSCRSIADEMFNQDRTIWFTSEVCPESCVQLATQLMQLEKSAPGEPITLMINSPGGDVASGLAVYDVMMNLKSPLRTVCFGYAASMGSILFLGGSERIMQPHSKILIHDPSFGGDLSGLKALDLKDDLESLLKMREILAGIIAQRCGRSVETIFEKTKKDTVMSAKEALEFGLATEIGVFIPTTKGV